jgi:hypothetical protein
MKRRNKVKKGVRKSSEIVIEMAEQILRPGDGVDHDAMSVALLLSQIAWNSEVDNVLVHDLSHYQQALIEIEIKAPNLWSQFISSDKDDMIRRLRLYKRRNSHLKPVLC